MTGKPSFFTELKRRNVLRAGALYIGAAWALSQGVAQLLPVFDFPNWVVRWFVIAAIIGFPFAMLFSWFYEWTPQGIQRESDVAPDASVTRETGRKLDRWIIAVLSIAVVLLLADIFVPHRDAQTAAAPSAQDKSIAVLPLFNLSGDAKDNYLGDGISEEVLTALSKLHGLKVIARASSFQFRDRDVDAVKVGRALNVRSLLAGTVQRDGENLRVSVELVDAGSGVQLWSQHYDRDFKNLFALEDDISSSVSTALAVKLGAAAGQPLVHAATNSPRAHDLYLQAKKLSYNSDEASLNYRRWSCSTRRTCRGGSELRGRLGRAGLYLCVPCRRLPRTDRSAAFDERGRREGGGARPGDGRGSCLPGLYPARLRTRFPGRPARTRKGRRAQSGIGGRAFLPRARPAGDAQSRRRTGRVRGRREDRSVQSLRSVFGTVGGHGNGRRGAGDP